MTKRKPPSFDPEPPARESPTGATGWVYRSTPDSATGVVPTSVLDSAPASVAIERSIPSADDPDVRALALVRRQARYAAFAGILPLPLVDLVSITAVQISMIAELAATYGQPYDQNRARAWIASLTGGTVSFVLGYGTARLLVRLVPMADIVARTLTMPVFAYASTYAIGKVFTLHFASGGLLLDFEPGRVRAYYQEQLAAVVRSA